MNNSNHQRRQAPRLTPIAAAAAVALWASPSLAQTVPAAAAEGNGLERIVITATSIVKSKLRSSASVTDVDNEQIRNLGARSEAEVLLLIPGIRTEPTAGPGGNSNISVRGLPISSGGSKYVQLQEDGLPTVQFGDMNFSNNDYWTRFDNNVDRIQALRGGSSSVLASHAPGAVINYISKTGKEKGGSFDLTKGLNFNETRVDADYGGQISNNTFYHLGGYYRQGEGARNGTPNSLLGYQLKGNLTNEFNGNKGYIRVNFKLLDEHAPTTPQTFVNASGTTSIGGFSKTNGYDGTRDSQYSIYNASVPGIDPLTRERRNTSLTDGISVNSRSVGLEFHNEMKNGFTVDNKFRMSKNAGAFQAQFWDVQTLANMMSGFGSGANSAKYFNGPLAGQTVTAANLQTGLVSKGAAINTQTPDMGNMVNDFSVNKQFLLPDVGKLDVTGGWFHSRQDVVQRWSISERVVEVGRNGAVIDVYNASGALTTAGLTGYNNQWGGCCARDIDASFTTDAPYLSLSLQSGNLDIDAGIRRETFRSEGSYVGGTARAYDVDGNGSISGAENSVYLIDPSAQRGLSNYKINYTNSSIGANYRLTNDLSAFVRTSKGYRAIADRLMFSSNINSVTGALTNITAALAPVTQSEIGAKFRGRAAGASYNVSATYFQSANTEYDYDQTRQDDPAKPNYQGPKLNQFGYKAKGIELESSVNFSGFGVDTNVTFSDSKKTQDLGNPGTVGKTESGVPKLRYTIAPSYTFGSARVGAIIRGQGKVYADGNNTVTIGGHQVVNAYVGYDFGGGLSAKLNVNNLLDKVYPTGGGGFVGGSSTVYGAGLETGRTVSATVGYKF